MIDLAQARINAQACSETAAALAPVAARTMMPRRRRFDVNNINAAAMLGNDLQRRSGIHHRCRNLAIAH